MNKPSLRSVPATVRVLVTDLDYTLFPPDEERLPDEFPLLIRRWRARGGTWILATGRTVGDLQEFYRAWPVLPDYTVARERFIIQHVVDRWFPYPAWNRRMMHRTLEVNRQSNRWIERLIEAVDDPDQFTKVDPRFVVFQQDEAARHWESWLKSRLPSGITPLRNRRYLALGSPEFGKGICLDRIQRARGWRAEELLAVGDSANDRDMLDGRFGYYPVAVNNAEPPVKVWVREAGGRVLEDPGGPGVVNLVRRLLQDLPASRR